ncbi:hypothetical protein ACVWWW_000563 [Lysobacter sp. HA18]
MRYRIAQIHRAKEKGRIAPALFHFTTRVSAMRVLAILGLVFDLFANLLDVLTGAGHRVAGGESAHRKHGKEQQGSQTLHGVISRVAANAAWEIRGRMTQASV